MASITSANAVIILTVPNVIPPVQLQAFAADDIYTTDAVDTAEIAMGVDGRLSAGFVFNPVRQSISLMADSPSIATFETWNTFEQQAVDKFFANATVTLSSIQRKFTCTNGVLMNFKKMPDAARTLRARQFLLVWESVIEATT